MKSKAGIVCVIMGVALLLGALVLSRANMQEDAEAKQAAMDVMPQLVRQIADHTAKESTCPAELDLQIPVELLTEEDKEMSEMEIDGELYIGYLSLPALGLDLPVQSGWSYPKLNISPCRYTGSVRGEDLVIMAHNYSAHFGKISKLNYGDQVVFSDMDGNVIVYEVVGKDILEATAVEEMTAGDFDLTLFTCTYGGANRVTVYCDRVIK